MRYIFTGGGTGGHVYPAIAIMDIVNSVDPNADIIYLGVKGKAEEHIIKNLPEDSKIPIRFISSTGMPRSLSPLRLMKFLLILLKGIVQAYKIIGEFKPDLITAAGGYVSAPVIIAGKLRKVKMMLHEQNTVPGLVNRYVGKLVDIVLLNFKEAEKYFDKQKVRVVGYPVRNVLSAKDKAESKKNLDIPVGSPLLFVFGGSSGAKNINESLVKALPAIMKNDDLVVVHGSGKDSPGYKANSATVEAAGSSFGDSYKDRYHIKDYFYNIDEVYSAADLIVCRAGAGTIMECASMGKPLLLLPKAGLPGNHQEENADTAAKTGGAVVLKEEVVGGVEQISSEKLSAIIAELVKDSGRLASMGEKIENIFVKNTNELIINEIQSLVSIDKKDYNLSKQDLRFERNLQSENWKIRNVAVKEIGTLKLDKYLDKIISFITDRTPAGLFDRMLGGDFKQVGFIRRNAVRTAAMLGGEPAKLEEAFLVALNDPYWEVRAAAAKFVVTVYIENQSAEIYDALLKTLSDKNFEVVYETVKTLTAITRDDKILPHFRKLYTHSNRRVKYVVRDGLLKLYKDGYVDKEIINNELGRIFVAGHYIEEKL